MANAPNNMPIVIDTDLASWRAASGYLQGIRVSKVALSAGPGGATTAGTVLITAPSDGALLYPPLAVPAASAAYTVLYTDNPDMNAPITWRDFAVTGVTASGTRLFIWYN